MALGVWLTMYVVLPTAFRTTSQSHATVVAPVDVGPRLPACANPALCVSVIAAMIPYDANSCLNLQGVSNVPWAQTRIGITV